MNEAEIIARLIGSQTQSREDVVVGIGDDAAVTRLDKADELVIATDTVVAGTHFPERTPSHAIGYRALAVNLSDLAAMGAEPMWASLSLCMPTADEPWIEGFVAGFLELAREHDVALIGGDTVRGPLAVTVTAHGRVPAGGAIGRNGAASGDAIYLTGYPGLAAAGCNRELGRPDAFATHDALRTAFLYPLPRLHEGSSLRGIASAMIDISDGLVTDLGHLLRASHAGAVIDTENVPLAPELIEHAGFAAALELALSGGDDYELCFTVPANKRSAFEKAAAEWSCQVSRLGEVNDGQGLSWMQDGRPIRISAPGFAHF